MFVKIKIAAYWYSKLDEVFEVFDKEEDWPADTPNDRNTVFDGHGTHYRLKNKELYIRKDHCIQVQKNSFDPLKKHMVTSHSPIYDQIMQFVCPYCEEKTLVFSGREAHCESCNLNLYHTTNFNDKWFTFGAGVNFHSSEPVKDDEDLSSMRRDAPVSNIDPGHYRDGKIEVIEFIMDKNLNFNRGNAVKYVVRAGKKNPETEVEDIRKAIRYLEFELERLQS